MLASPANTGNDDFERMIYVDGGGGNYDYDESYI